MTCVRDCAKSFKPLCTLCLSSTAADLLWTVMDPIEIFAGPVGFEFLFVAV